MNDATVTPIAAAVAPLVANVATDPAAAAEPYAPPAHGRNTIDGKARPFIDRVESVIADMESDKGAYMAKCRAHRGRIKDILAEAKEAGLPVRSMRGIVKYRGLERKQAKIAAGFDDVDESAVYQQLVDTLGELGAAAARAAGFNFPAAGSGAPAH